MGFLNHGVWETDDGKWASTDGSFKRAASQFRCKCGETEIIPEADRYLLYVSLACPWAHRALIFRKLKELEEIIPVTIVDPHMLDFGWQFTEPEPLYGFTHAHELYSRAAPDYTGRVTVPILWDKQ
ncbi:MAG: glutathione S-transferase family protein, partial [Mariprofundus sp.]